MRANAMKKFLLVDDHSVVRSGIRLFIRDKYFNAEIDEASEGDKAFESVKKKDYDLLIMDLHMPKTDTVGLITNILKIKPSTKILVFSMGAEEVFARRYLSLGVMGFLNKDCSDDKILIAIETVLNNRRYLSEKLMDRLTGDSVADKPVNPFDALSTREIEIAMLLINGRSVGEITGTLSIQNSTVGTHKARIFEKLQVNNVIDLHELARLYQII